MRNIALFQRQNSTFLSGKACLKRVYSKKIHRIKFYGCSTCSVFFPFEMSTPVFPTFPKPTLYLNFILT